MGAGRMAVAGVAEPHDWLVIFAVGVRRGECAGQFRPCELGGSDPLSGWAGPGIVSLDAALHREFRVREGMSLALRVESFNFSNTSHYSNPNGNRQSPQFGEINGAEQDQRRYQIGLTLRF